MKFLISGNKAGLGKHLYENLPGSIGFGRGEVNLIKHSEFDAIIHCAFNKESNPKDLYSYLDDNIFLTAELCRMRSKKMIYISSIDIYNNNETLYSTFKKFSESIVIQNPNNLILRCSMMVGPTMRENHLTKIKDNRDKIGLHRDSTFNYILMDDILNFIQSGEYIEHCGIIDFVSNTDISLYDVRNFFNSNTDFGEYKYSTFSLEKYKKIYNLNTKYSKTSLQNLTRYFL